MNPSTKSQPYPLLRVICNATGFPTLVNLSFCSFFLSQIGIFFFVFTLHPTSIFTLSVTTISQAPPPNSTSDRLTIRHPDLPGQSPCTESPPSADHQQQTPNTASTSGPPPLSHLSHSPPPSHLPSALSRRQSRLKTMVTLVG